MFAPGHASLQPNCQPRALYMTSIASRTARACLGTVSAPFFLVLPTDSELCPRAGILESRRHNQRPRQPVLPFCRGSTDLVLICGKSQAVLRGISPDYGSWSKWAYSSLGPRSLCLGHSVLPLPCETGGSRWDFVAIFFSSSSSIQTVYMGLSTGVYFTSTTAGRNDWQSFSPGGTEFSLHPHQSATA